MNQSSTELNLWHGGSRWDGAPEIRPAKTGRAECGPGLYLTTSYATARKYAKGGKVVTKVQLPAPSAIRWLEDAQLSRQAVLDFLKASRMRNKNIVIADVLALYKDEQMPAAALVNLCVNHDAGIGQAGVLLANWLAAQGIDASLYAKSGQEHWIVVFNPAILLKWTVTKPSDIKPDAYDLPLIKKEKLMTEQTQTARDQFMKSMEELAQADQEARNGVLKPWPFAQIREACLARATVELAKMCGCTIKPITRIDARGEVHVVCEEGSQFGAEFAKLLNKASPRCGINPGAVMHSDSGWCYVNHFGLSAMLDEVYQSFKATN